MTLSPLAASVLAELRERHDGPCSCRHNCGNTPCRHVTPCPVHHDSPDLVRARAAWDGYEAICDDLWMAWFRVGLCGDKRPPRDYQHDCRAGWYAGAIWRAGREQR